MTLIELYRQLQLVRADLAAGRYVDALYNCIPLMEYLLDSLRSHKTMENDPETMAKIVTELQAIESSLDGMATAANIGDGRIIKFIKFVVINLLPIFL